jgi:hypothetical protein
MADPFNLIGDAAGQFANDHEIEPINEFSAVFLQTSRLRFGGTLCLRDLYASDPWRATSSVHSNLDFGSYTVRAVVFDGGRAPEATLRSRQLSRGTRPERDHASALGLTRARGDARVHEVETTNARRL